MSIKKYFLALALFVASGFSTSITNYSDIIRISVLTNPINGKRTTNFIISSDAGSYLQAMLYYTVYDVSNAYLQDSMALYTNGSTTNGANQFWNGKTLSNVLTLQSTNATIENTLHAQQLKALLSYLTNAYILSTLTFAGSGMSGITITNATSNNDNSDSELVVASLTYALSNYFQTRSSANATHTTNVSNTLQGRTEINALFATNNSNAIVASSNQHRFFGITSTAITNSTTSTTYVLMHSNLSNFVTTNGVYFVQFKSTASCAAAGDIGLASVFTNGVRVDDSEVQIQGTDLVPFPTFTQISVTGSTRIEIYYRVAAADTVSVINPSVRITKLP